MRSPNGIQQLNKNVPIRAADNSAVLDRNALHLMQSGERKDLGDVQVKE
jgi:hypothetical protein